MLWVAEPVALQFSSPSSLIIIIITVSLWQWRCDGVRCAVAVAVVYQILKRQVSNPVNWNSWIQTSSNGKCCVTFFFSSWRLCFCFCSISIYNTSRKSYLASWMQPLAYCFDDRKCLKSVLVPDDFGTRYSYSALTCIWFSYFIRLLWSAVCLHLACTHGTEGNSVHWPQVW